MVAGLLALRCSVAVTWRSWCAAVKGSGKVPVTSDASMS
jgi:hypothetical protein